MDCEIAWNTSRVDNGQLSARLRPAPDFAFMKEFDGLLIRHEDDHQGRWGVVQIAEGNVVVSDVKLESAHELRAFLDDTVREANRLSVDTRVRDREEAAAEVEAAAQREAADASAAQEAAKSDAKLTDEFRGAA